MTATAARSYKIASGDTLTNLEKAVNQYISGGWMPYGPPFITHDNRIVQALILPVGANAVPAATAPQNPGFSAVAPQQAPQQQQARPQQPVPQQAPQQASAPAAQPAPQAQPGQIPAQQQPPQQQRQAQPVAVQPRV
jgi:hypothetical protein